MRITLDVPDEIVESAECIAQKAGTDRDTILNDALRAQLSLDSPEMHAEFAQWEAASDIDAAKMAL